MERGERQENIARVPFWWHSIEVGDGLVTPGIKTLDFLERELASLHLPDLAGRTVLDVGAWDGFFSFTAEQRGASRVLALDHYVWQLDLATQQAYWKRCLEAGQVPSPYHLVPGQCFPGALPGKAGFDTAHRLRESRVEQMVADFMTVPPDEVGSFDVVLFLGVLYHLPDPLRALRRLAARAATGVDVRQPEPAPEHGLNVALCARELPGAPHVLGHTRVSGEILFDELRSGPTLDA